MEPYRPHKQYVAPSKVQWRLENEEQIGVPIQNHQYVGDCAACDTLQIIHLFPCGGSVIAAHAIGKYCYVGRSVAMVVQRGTARTWTLLA